MLTVALPTYNNKDILWLPLEGLANQIDPPSYELLIYEDGEDNCAGELIEQYAERLFSNGCVRICLLQSLERVSLPYKWRLMGQRMDKESLAFLLQGSDDYPHPHRLANTYKHFHSGGLDWYDEGEFYSYDVNLRKVIKYTGVSGFLTGNNMALAPEYAKCIPFTTKVSGIDGFLYQHCKNIKGSDLVHYRESKPYYKEGVSTNGANTISKFRQLAFINPAHPWEDTTVTLNYLLPNYIVEKLKQVRVTSENQNYNKMEKYRFKVSRNVYKKGEVRELSEAVASLYLKEGIVEPIEREVKITEKVLTPNIQDKELKVTKIEKDVRGTNQQREPRGRKPRSN